MRETEDQQQIASLFFWRRRLTKIVRRRPEDSVNRALVQSAKRGAHTKGTERSRNGRVDIGPGSGQQAWDDASVGLYIETRARNDPI